jgi:hypothetical protein
VSAPHVLGDNLATCLVILIYASTLLTLLEARLRWRSSRDCSSE